MVNVCAHYCGSTILLAELESEEAAGEFMKHDYILFYADEILNADEDVVIHPDEMFVEDEIPFCEPIHAEYEQSDELPF